MTRFGEGGFVWHMWAHYDLFTMATLITEYDYLKWQQKHVLTFRNW